MQSDQPYLTVMDHNFDETVINNKQPVLVVFATEWSGSCHIIDPILKGLASKYKNRIKFCKIDADKNTRTTLSYGIYEFPTLLFFKNGQIIDHISGVVTKKELGARIERMLESADSSESSINSLV